jgi:hypothetical protein
MNCLGSEVQITRIRRIAKQLTLLPLVLLTAPSRWVKELLFHFQLKPAQELNAIDELRQATVHREPRRLSPNHIAESPQLK